MDNPNVNQLPATVLGSATNNVPRDIEALKDSINGGSLIRRLSQAQIDALSGSTRPIGLTVYNATSGRVEVWTGSRWEDVSARAVYATGWSTSDQSVAVGASATVLYGAENDPLGLLSGGTFTAPSTGVYVLTAHAKIMRGGATGLYARANLVVAGATVTTQRISDASASVSEMSVNLTTVMPMAAADTASMVLENQHLSDGVFVRGRLGAVLVAKG